MLQAAAEKAFTACWCYLELHWAHSWTGVSGYSDKAREESFICVPCCSRTCFSYPAGLSVSLHVCMRMCTTLPLNAECFNRSMIASVVYHITCVLLSPSWCCVRMHGFVSVLPSAGKNTSPCAGGESGVPGADNRWRPVSEDCLVMIWETVRFLTSGDPPRNTGFSWPWASLGTRTDTRKRSVEMSKNDRPDPENGCHTHCSRHLRLAGLFMIAF